MAEFVYFTVEQIDRANAVPILDILREQGEKVERSGPEWRWKKHSSVTLRDDCWYRHSREIGGHAIDFLQEFYGMDFQEAVTWLLNGETGQTMTGTDRPVKKKESTRKQKQEPKELCLPERNADMKRVYAYLIKQRFLDKNIIDFFARAGFLYESKEHHNAVFLGMDAADSPRHAHIKGTYSEGEGFRRNAEGSDPSYGFGYHGKSSRLYVFEAPIDFLSFLTLYQGGWREHSYTVLNGVAEHAMLRMLKDNPHIDTIVLCLDHDPAGTEACGRLKEVLFDRGYGKVKRLLPKNKDWNEDVKERNGVRPLPAREHPKVEECRSWCNVLKEVCAYTSDERADIVLLSCYVARLGQEMELCGGQKEMAETMDGQGMLIAGIAIKIAEKYSYITGEPQNCNGILDRISRGYCPHKDKGNLRQRTKDIIMATEDIKKRIERVESHGGPESQEAEEIAIRCMGLGMECVKAHIFAALECREHNQEMEVEMACIQS